MYSTNLCVIDVRLTAMSLLINAFLWC